MSSDILIHELGHTVVGHELGILEGGIQLCDPATGELARAHFSIKGTTRKARIARGLGGAYAQAKIRPNDLPEGLPEQILDGSVFSSHADHIEAGTVPEIVAYAGFSGDWQSVIRVAHETAQNVSEIVEELESAHRCLAVIFQDRQLEKKILRAMTDFETWLDQHDDDIPFMPMLIYPATRLIEVLNGIQV